MSGIKCEVKGYEDIEFEVGQQWRTRDGKVVEIKKVFDDDYLSYPIDITNGTSYTRNGREHKHRESNNDLIELVGVPVEEEVEEDIITVDTQPCEVPGYKDVLFKKGQKWKTRGGKVVEIKELFSASRYTWPIKCTNNIIYTLKGIEHPGSTTDNDLVELVDNIAAEPAEKDEDNTDLWEYADNDEIKVVDATKFILHEPSVEDKMVEILHQLLRQRDRDLEKISLVFNTFIELEKMK